MSTSLVFACLSGRLELEDLFLLKKKDKRQTRTSHRIFTENLNGQTPFLGFPTHSGVPSGHFQRIPKRTPKRTPKHPKPKPREIPGRVAWAPRQIRPNAAFDLWRRTWAAGGHNSRRPRGREAVKAIAEIPNGLASETLQSLIKLRRDQGGSGKVIFVREKLFFVFNIREKSIQKDCKSTPSVTVTL